MKLSEALRAYTDGVVARSDQAVITAAMLDLNRAFEDALTPPPAAPSVSVPPPKPPTP